MSLRWDLFCFFYDARFAELKLSFPSPAGFQLLAAQSGRNDIVVIVNIEISFLLWILSSGKTFSTYTEVFYN